MYQYWVSDKTISKFIPEVADAIFNVLKDEYLKFPQSKQEWLEISRGIYDKWQFTICKGAMDSKHIPIKCPKGDGSTFFSYKGFHSIVLLGLADSGYKFIFIQVGWQGCISDGVLFRNTELYNRLVSDELNLPDPMELQNPVWNFTGESMSTPFVIVGDEAFPLNKHLMKQYAKIELDDSKRIFNYRLLRFRRCSENAFGIIAAQFRTVNSPINLAPEKVTKLVLAIPVLNNFLLTKSRGSYLASRFVDEENLETGEVITGEWRQNIPAFTPLEISKSRKTAVSTKTVRDIFKDYFMGAWQVEWQWKMIN